MPYAWWSPQLNHTGELKAPIWLTRYQVSSASKASASCGVAKYPPCCSPETRSVWATRCTSSLTDSSAPDLVGTPALRKYLLTATSVASWDQLFGTSASSILKTTSPSAPEILAGRRVHSTSASTSAAVCPSRVFMRSTAKPRDGRERIGEAIVFPFSWARGAAGARGGAGLRGLRPGGTP